MPYRLLYVVPYTPNQIRVRPYQLLRNLAARGHAVTLATLWSNDEERGQLGALAAAGVQIVSEPLTRVQTLRNIARAAPSGLPLQALYCRQPTLEQTVRRLAGSGDFDVVQVEHLRGAPYALAAAAELQKSRPGSALVWDSVDCISHLFRQASRASGSLRGRLMTRLELGRTERYEGRLVRGFDRTVVTSPQDQRALAELALAAGAGADICRKIAVTPNGVALDYFHPGGEPAGNAIVLSGKMSYHANVTAAIYLVRQVMPLVWQERPDAQAWIVGKDPTAQVRALAGGAAAGRVHVTGTVDDLRPYLQRAAVAAAPVPYGAGIQNKVLEAMACGAPVVASPQAVSALLTTPGQDVLVEESAAGFAAAVVELLNSPQRARALGAAGRRYVETHHDWQGSVRRLEEIYAAALDEKKERTRVVFS